MRAAPNFAALAVTALISLPSVFSTVSLAGTGGSSLERTWYLPGKYDIADKELPTMTLKDGRVSGTDGCNRLIGSYEVRSKRLITFKVGSTMTACPDMAAANAFHAVMRDARKFTVRRDRLILHDANGKALVIFTAILK